MPQWNEVRRMARSMDHLLGGNLVMETLVKHPADRPETSC